MNFASPESDKQNASYKEKEKEKEKDNTPLTPLPLFGDEGPDTLGPTPFDQFWAVYPKKVGKGDASKAWNKLKPGKHLIEKILSAVEAAKNSAEWKKDGGQFIPHPTTWLNQGRWDDELTPAKGAEAYGSGINSGGIFGRENGANTEHWQDFKPTESRGFKSDG